MARRRARDDARSAQAEMEKTADTTIPEGFDPGTTRATKSTVRGVLKRFEDAFGTGRKGTGRG